MSKGIPIQSFKLDEKGLTHIFGELEARLMEAVWALDEPSVQEVIDHLGGGLNYKTAMTVMNRLVEKGLLARRKAGRAFVYAATASRDELLAQVFDKMVRGMFNSDFRQIALTQMIETVEALDASLLDDISRLIQQKKWMNKRMADTTRGGERDFGLLLGVTGLLAGSGLLFSWVYGRRWLPVLWQACRQVLADGMEYLPLLWPLIVPALLLAVTVRGASSLLLQVRATLRLSRTFYPLRQTPPARLQGLLAGLAVPLERVVFLDLAAPHAFCLGFWRPRIWLTAGLVCLLAEEELAAVLVHEMHHCRHRHPLRLALSRALKAAFFFLPAVGHLADSIELQQEIAADRSAIAHLGGDLPLLCALQKLLRAESPTGAALPAAAYSPFNVTEARLRCLLYPPAPTPWRKRLAGWAAHSAAILLLGSVAFSSASAAMVPDHASPCHLDAEKAGPPALSLPADLGYNLPRSID